ncbi:hypothetical protein FRC08_009531 [Ceratobasidium sp. 394]|nr:hypothetical protein FRC08_009531 [Ceratobasidium sp. 394]
MRVRWARFGDRKLRGARKRSEWYQVQEGRNKRSRGREGENMDLDAELDEMKRRREAGDESEVLDAELDVSVWQKGSEEDASTRLRDRLGPKKDRQIAPLPRRRGGGHRSHERPKRTQDDLDAELEAFMKARE